MASLTVPQPLIMNGITISFPYTNPQADCLPIHSFLVNINENGNTQTISLKHCAMKYYPRFNEYINKNSQNSLFSAILNYYDTIIETPVEFVCYFTISVIFKCIL